MLSLQLTRTAWILTALSLKKDSNRSCIGSDVAQYHGDIWRETLLVRPSITLTGKIGQL